MTSGGWEGMAPGAHHPSLGDQAPQDVARRPISVCSHTHPRGFPEGMWLMMDLLPFMAVQPTHPHNCFTQMGGQVKLHLRRPASVFSAHFLNIWVQHVHVTTTI